MQHFKCLPQSDIFSLLENNYYTAIKTAMPKAFCATLISSLQCPESEHHRRQGSPGLPSDTCSPDVCTQTHRVVLPLVPVKREKGSCRIQLGLFLDGHLTLMTIIQKLLALSV